MEKVFRSLLKRALGLCEERIEACVEGFRPM